MCPRLDQNNFENVKQFEKKNVFNSTFGFNLENKEFSWKKPLDEYFKYDFFKRAILSQCTIIFF